MRQGCAADGHRRWSVAPVGCRSGSEYYSLRPKGLDTTREVPRELIEDCLRVAMHAPIGSNGLYPHFVVVTDPAKRTALAGFYKQAWDAYLPLPLSAANLHFEDPNHEAQQAPCPAARAASAASLRASSASMACCADDLAEVTLDVVCVKGVPLRVTKTRHGQPDICVWPHVRVSHSSQSTSIAR